MNGQPNKQDLLNLIADWDKESDQDRLAIDSYQMQIALRVKHAAELEAIIDAIPDRPPAGLTVCDQDDCPGHASPNDRPCRYEAGPLKEK